MRTSIVTICLVVGLACGWAGPQALVQAAAIQHFWDFEGPDTFNDKVGTAHGSVTADTTVTTATGHDGNTAMQTVSSVTGPDDFVTIDSSATFNPGTTPFSMTYWFNIEDDDSTVARGLFDFSGTTGDGPQSLHIGTTNNLAYRVDGLDGGGAALFDNGGAGFEDGQWHFVAALYDPVNGIELHVDGAGVDASNPGSFGSVTFDPVQILGSFNFTGATENKGLNGRLDDVAIYRGLLTNSEIAGLFDGTLRPAQIVPEPAAISMVGLLGMVLAWQLARRGNQHL